MGLARTFVSFSSSDIRSYYLMTAWKAHTGIDFNFADCQIDDAINSENETYVKRVLRERINLAGTQIILIGNDTRFKTRFVKWENEVAIEKGCRLIAVNLDGGRRINKSTCPSWLDGVGALFLSFSPKIIQFALDKFERKDTGNWHYDDDIYKQAGL